jgi:hypothetical protein
MLCFLLAVLLPTSNVRLAQDQSVHVTYTTRAARISQIVRELSQVSKVNLVASPQTENDVLVISVKDVTLSDLLSKIATVTSGEWKQDGTTMRLVADTKARKQEEQEELALRVANIRKAIQGRADQQKKAEERQKKMMADLEKAANKPKADGKAKTKDEDAVNPEDFMPGASSSPEDIAITAILQTLDPTTLAVMEDGDRVVFSTDPTHTQRSLGADVTEIVNTLIEKHNASVALMQGAHVDDSDQFAGMDENQAKLIRQMMKKQTEKIGQVSKALLIASVANSMVFTQIQLELRLYDPKGGVAFTGNSFLSPNGNSMFGGMDFASSNVVSSTASDDGTVVATSTTSVSPLIGQAPAKSQAKATPIDYSEDTKTLQQSSKGMIGGQYTLHFPQELKQKLFMPNQYDPLSFADTDEVLSYAKSQNKPLVANLPDGDSSMFNMFGKSTTNTLESYTEALKKGKSILLIPDSGCVVIKPARPYQSRTTRLDRIALTNLLQATADKGIPSLDDISTYATLAPNPMSGGISMGYLMFFVPGAVQMGMDGSSSWDMLRFYGQLAPEMRNSLANGGKLPIGNLTAGERASLERMTYGSSSQLSVDDPSRKPEDETPSWMKMAMGSGSIDYRDEPTEIVPNGLPSDGFVELKGTSEPFAAPVASPDSMVMAMIGVLGPDELALFKMMRSQKGAEQFSAMFPKFPKLRIGDRSVMNFTFHVAPQVSLKQTLKDHHLDKNSSIFSEDNLPSDLQKKIAEREDALKKTPFGSMAGMFGGAGAIHP